MVTYQPSIFDQDTAADLRPLVTVSREKLSRGAWVDHLPGWVQGSDGVLELLLTQVPWRAERRVMYDRTVDVPRLLCWYGPGDALPHDVLTRARDALNRHYEPAGFSGSAPQASPEAGERFVTAGMCLYRDGRDSVAWHGDTIGRGAHTDTMVAIVSFGSPRYLHLRPRGGGESRRFALGHGDLLVMGGSCQRTWEHAIPKTAQSVGPRVSVQFRPEGVS